ncbi:MAG: type IX secretion system outer membrane channel protein PorV [Prevotellaceae bacterium]|jgi:hypothetical protein|nr:type IX secretion system outer membrane channel protein PorV [Prevotellaceae bacterium]
MRKRLLLLGLTACVVTFLQAQATDEIKDSYNPILTGVPSLGIAPDAVSGGMGDIGAATTPTLSSQYWNSSKYAMMEGPGGFALSYTPWLRKIVSDIDLAYLSGYYNLGEKAGTLSASFRYFSLGNITLTDVNGHENGIAAKPYELALDLGYSRKLSEKFAMGVVLRFLASDLSAQSEDYYTGYGFAADVNGYYTLPIEIKSGESKFGFGFNISNIGTKVSYDKGNSSNFIPTNLRFGASYLIPFDKYNRIAVNADVNRLLVPSRKSKNTKGFDPQDESTWTMEYDQYSDISIIKGIFSSFSDAPGGFKEEMKEFSWSLGAEYAYNEQFFVRTGYHHENVDKGNRKYFTFGAGFKWTAFRLDVGYVVATAPTNPLDQTLRFTLSFDVDGLKELTDNK